MNIYPYINSKDVADHLKDLEYQFSAAEKAYLVYLSRGVTLEEKLAAWELIIAEDPDCEMLFVRGDDRFESTHEFLRRYIDFQRRILVEFFDNADAIYFPAEARYSGEEDGFCYIDGRTNCFTWTEYERRPFSSLDECIDYLRREREDDGDTFDLYRIEKAFLSTCAGDDYRCDRMLLNDSFQALEVDIGKLSDEDFELEIVFENAFVALPVPFRYGDMVVEPARYSYYSRGEARPFVFDSLKFWDLDTLRDKGIYVSPEREHIFRDKIPERLARHSFDCSHMVAMGYEMGGGDNCLMRQPYCIWNDEFGACNNYLLLEFCREPLKDNFRILEVVSDALQGKANPAEIINRVNHIALSGEAKKMRDELSWQYNDAARPYYEDPSQQDGQEE